MLTHRNLLFSAKVSAVLRGLGPDDRIYGVLPMSHIVGLTIILVASLMFGATVLVLPNMIRPTLQTPWRKTRFPSFTGYPPPISACSRTRLQAGSRSCLAICATLLWPGRLSISRSRTGLSRRFGLPLTNGFGITECSTRNLWRARVRPARGCTWWARSCRVWRHAS